MNIKQTDNLSFRGYDARPLRGFLMSANIHGIADEMQKIGNKEGFKIYSPYNSIFEEKCGEYLPPYRKMVFNVWAQDYWTIIKDKLISRDFDNTAKSIKRFFGLKYNTTQSKLRQNLPLIDDDMIDSYLANTHIPGGNVFITKNGSKNEVIIGKNELKKFSVKDIKSIYGVNKVTVLPQMDFHLDLFIRPLDKKRVLLADDNMSLGVLDQMISKLDNNKTIQAKMKNFRIIYKNMIKKKNKFAQANRVEKILQQNGYEVIRVPGRIYTVASNNLNKPTFLIHQMNFMNANVLINKEGKLVFITNKSHLSKNLGLTKNILEKIGGGFEDYFIKAISPYVSPEHIYFVKGKNNFLAKKLLSEYQGGIHCTCAEIPK